VNYNLLKLFCNSIYFITFAPSNKTTMKNKPLLSSKNYKTQKGEKLNYKTLILYMSPFTANSKGINVCSHASKGCAEACLVGSGNGGMFTQVKQGRINKTEYFLRDRVGFLNQLKSEIERAIKNLPNDFTLVVRLNGTSDLPFEKFKVFDGKNIFEVFNNIQFYDYTKNYLRFDKVLPSNYHLTFSRSEINHEKSMEMLKRGFNVAMVFKTLPETYGGFKVVNGDETDLRFLDEKNVIVGLKYKQLTGKGVSNKEVLKNGFVIDVKHELYKAKFASIKKRLEMIMNKELVEK
jgi:hypothetical protein